MSYMTFEQQTIQHLQFLRKEGLEISNLIIDSPEFIRSRTKGELGRGEYTYKTVSRMLNNGMMGLMTWCRSKKGKISTYKTYGRPFNSIDKGRYFSGASSQVVSQSIMRENIPLAVNLEKIRKFWELSSLQGVSDYLNRKGVGSYRIRFRENQYGKVAIIPIVDIRGKLCGYQMLNSNGSKVFANGMQLNGAFHRLTKLTDNLAIGIAESYVTAATCLEIVGIPMVTAFTSNNLEHVALALQERYPNSPLVIFADNDTHLNENKGIISAIKALGQAKSGGLVLAPQFKNCPCGKDYSDWNDLVRESGRLSAIVQLNEGLNQTQDDRIECFHIKLRELLNF
jgi:hypothetical protein